MMNKQEIEKVSRLEPLERYKYFIKKVADYEELWTLVDEMGEYALLGIDQYTLISLWPAKEYIDGYLGKEWEDCRPIKLSLENFENNLCPIISEYSYLINVFPINGKTGLVVSLEEFNKDMESELEKYL